MTKAQAKSILDDLRKSEDCIEDEIRQYPSLNRLMNWIVYGNDESKYEPNISLGQEGEVFDGEAIAKL